MNEKVSILMGAYNCGGTLAAAVRSIMKQTYKNWELIICDDGSKDNTYETAERLAAEDDRIIVIRNETNLGLNVTLNNCLKQASGDYVARMDGDDECLPDRFEKQVRFLRENPEFDIVSSWMSLFDESGEWGMQKTPEYPTPAQVVTGSPICHAPVMIRRECIDRAGGYSEESYTLRVEDVDLWIRLYSMGCRAYNIQEPLYRMRNDKNAFSRRKYMYRVNSTKVRLKGCRLLHLGPKCYLKAFKPMIKGLVPARIRARLTKKRRGV